MDTNHKNVGPDRDALDPDEAWIVAYEQHVVRGGPTPPDVLQHLTVEDQR